MSIGQPGASPATSGPESCRHFPLDDSCPRTHILKYSSMWKNLTGCTELLSLLDPSHSTLGLRFRTLSRWESREICRHCERKSSSRPTSPIPSWNSVCSHRQRPKASSVYIEFVTKDIFVPGLTISSLILHHVAYTAVHVGKDNPGVREGSVEATQLWW